jgi:hypothetical protein
MPGEIAGALALDEPDEKGVKKWQQQIKSARLNI